MKHDPETGRQSSRSAGGKGPADQLPGDDASAKESRKGRGGLYDLDRDTLNPGKSRNSEAARQRSGMSDRGGNGSQDRSPGPRDKAGR